MSTREEDLNLLMSIGIPETPPESPSRSQGYLSDDGSPYRRPKASADMSIFREAVKEYLSQNPVVDLCTADKNPKSNKIKESSDIVMEKFSGLRIRNPLLSVKDINNHFADVRFVRLPAIRNLMLGENTPGCWATVGVLTEKGQTKVSSNGKNFSVWKLGTLDELIVSVFLFGDAHSKNSHEPVGTIFALINSSVRKDTSGKGFSLSIFSNGQILKMGISADYIVCKGKRKDGIACTMVINKCQGIYCKFHSSKAGERYVTTRSELKGGNLRTAFRPRSEGIYMVDPLKDRSNAKHGKAVKVMSVDGLKRVLSKADKVTTQRQSQGIRFLTEVTAAKMEPNKLAGGPTRLTDVKASSTKRPCSIVKGSFSIGSTSHLPDAKRKKIQDSSKMIELDIVSSDEER
ncbi:hypothetical protein ZOSMA_1G03020 [Zostera marina]|uniref:Uncharacterized protein n=1 Tax=Zostera marina TaxID=29655 RepID=A0A0K9PMX4_ZOSMR|nr:hypothetical protein ZOSMA_1G03020 [Zostera marina]